MVWIDPIFDRTQADIDNRARKAFWNVLDWSRVHGNAEYIRALIDVLRAVNVSLEDLPEPTVTTIPSASDINRFVQNLEKLRIASGLSLDIGLKALKTDYLSGTSAKSPDFNEVNNWERNLALIKKSLLDSSAYEVFSGVSSVGQVRFWQNRFRTPFVRPSDNPSRRPRTGVAKSGSGLKRQNKFRRYS